MNNQSQTNDQPQDGILEDYSFVDTEAIAYGPGSIVASAEDLAVFFDSLASGDLLQPESTAEMFNYVDVQIDGNPSGNPSSNPNSDNSADPASNDTAVCSQTEDNKGL